MQSLKTCLNFNKHFIFHSFSSLIYLYLYIRKQELDLREDLFALYLQLFLKKNLKSNFLIYWECSLIEMFYQRVPWFKKLDTTFAEISMFNFFRLTNVSFWSNQFIKVLQKIKTDRWKNSVNSGQVPYSFCF